MDLRLDYTFNHRSDDGETLLLQWDYELQCELSGLRDGSPFLTVKAVLDEGVDLWNEGVEGTLNRVLAQTVITAAQSDDELLKTAIDLAEQQAWGREVAA